MRDRVGCGGRGRGSFRSPSAGFSIKFPQFKTPEEQKKVGQSVLCSLQELTDPFR